MQALAMAFLMDQIALLQQERWTIDNVIGLIIEGGFSYRQVDMIRAALSLDYDPVADRYFHPIWLQHVGEYIRVPEPVPSRALWAAALRVLKSELKIDRR